MSHTSSMESGDLKHDTRAKLGGKNCAVTLKSWSSSNGFANKYHSRS